MSPEQAAGDTFDGRSDLFSLGIVLYECATGRRPFVGNSARAVLAAILNTAPPAPGTLNPDLPQRLQQVISDCLEKEPDLRYQNAASLRADLKRVKRDLESGRTGSVTLAGASSDRTPAPSAGDHAPIPTPPPAARRLAPTAIVVAVAVVAIAAAAIGYFRRSVVVDEPETTAVVSSSDTFVQSRFELAERSLRDQQYRDAQRYSDDVLTAAPDHAKAREIRDRAAGFLRQAETDIARARDMIQAGDVRGAVRALDEARTLDPVAPGLVEVSRLMAERFKSQAEAAELELQRSRATAPAQRAAVPSAPSSPPTPPRATSTAPVPTETPREPAAQALPPPPQSVPAPVVPSPRPAPTESATVKPEPVKPEPVKPEPAPVAPPQVRNPPEAPREADDESAIRSVVAAYARAIESKDLALFRSIKPNLGAEEERRIQQGFRAVTSQKVNLTITSIDRRGDRAILQLRRQDIIEAGGRRQSPESRQTMTLAKSNGNWFIVEIGR